MAAWMMTSPQTGALPPNLHPLTFHVLCVPSPPQTTCSWGRIANICSDEEDNCSCIQGLHSTTSAYGQDMGQSFSLLPAVSQGTAKTCVLAVSKADWALAWPHQWSLPTSKKTKATWPLSEQMELTPALPALVLNEDRNRHGLQTSSL